MMVVNKFWDQTFRRRKEGKAPLMRLSVAKPLVSEANQLEEVEFKARKALKFMYLYLAHTVSISPYC